MSLTLRYMHPNDVPQIVKLDELAFPDPWPHRSYMFEINESKISYMCSLIDDEAAITAPPRSWLDRLLRRTAPHRPQPLIVAYGGLWCIADEAHVSTIATHPQYRGRGYGEIALAGMLVRAISLNAAYVVLEVRVGNRVAQALYHKYGFVTTDTNRRYYRDGEDAFVMRLDIHDDTRQQVEALAARLHRRIPLADQYSRTPHPRL